MVGPPMSPIDPPSSCPRRPTRRARGRLVPVVLVVALLLPARPAPGGASESPWQATVFGTPEAAQADVPEQIPYRVRTTRRFPGRTVPVVFWTGDELDYGISLQEDAAPLAFVISGTGGDYDESKTLFLQRALYGAGFHVVALPSPTRPVFITAASESSMPGYTPADAADLYAVMQSIHAELRQEVEVEHVVLAGYSLGATEAAFVGALDRDDGALGLRRIYLVNPAVDVFGAARNLDRLWSETLPGGIDMAAALLRRLLRHAVHWIHAGNQGSLDAEFLLRFAAQAGVGELELKQVVAAVFRLSAANMVFSADVMTGRGAIVPPDRTLRISTSLTPYLERSLDWSFLRYLDELLVPYWLERRPDLNRDGLIAGASLRSLRAYLSGNQDIAVTTNADDFMLGPGDLAFLERTFGERASVHPNGGHGGNLESRAVIEELVTFLRTPAAGDS